jgi:hypothetical protein
MYFQNSLVSAGAQERYFNQGLAQIVMDHFILNFKWK